MREFVSSVHDRSCIAALVQCNMQQNTGNVMAGFRVNLSSAVSSNL